MKRRVARTLRRWANRLEPRREVTVRWELDREGFERAMRQARADDA